MPGYTHTQEAQPITLGFWASAYVSMFNRDIERLDNAYRNVNTNPLGAAALAGTSFPIDRKLTARLLGFDSVHVHTLDVISSRDFMAETLSALAILMSNLSKLSEELVYWSTYEFGFLAQSAPRPSAQPAPKA
ncbi:lyase family protein, partial [Desulfosalsimonas sp.]|uniref:lyase family protein n=1 Tax=Desulfosalsimonas sp. TaxID=3073848 RepID=UPI003970D900